ncbi:hypothetical protein YC2023_060038 [Brassica napus]
MNLPVKLLTCKIIYDIFSGGELEKIKMQGEDLYLPTAPSMLVKGIQIDSGIPLQSVAKRIGNLQKHLYKNPMWNSTESQTNLLFPRYPFLLLFLPNI